jgi:beta-glucuronidase
MATRWLSILALRVLAIGHGRAIVAVPAEGALQQSQATGNRGAGAGAVTNIGPTSIGRDGRRAVLTVHLRSLILTLLLAVCATGVARAQGPVYRADTPAKRALYRDGSTERYLVGGTWLYRADASDSGVPQGFWRNTASTDGWALLTVPNAYNAGDLSRASMVGSVGWYRKDFRLPAAFPRGTAAGSQHWIIRFESVNYRAQIWLNGRLIGSHAGGYEPFELDLPGLRTSGVNRLVVRVDDHHLASDLPPGGFYSDGVTPVGGWWNYGGILREVYLRAVDGADLAQVQVRPLLPCPTCAATIDEQVVLRNVTGLPQAVHLRGSYGSAFLDFGAQTIPAHSTLTASATARVVHPRLWAPDSPNLYRATLTLSGAHGRRLGGYVTWSGIRSIAVTPDGLLTLNGRRLNLRGVGLHEADLQLGAALDTAHLERLFGWAREVGAKLIRSHYPLNPEIEELADRYGVLLWSEVPVYQVKSQYLDNPAWVAQAHSVLETNILTNQNHPSVLLWSVGNELPSPATASERSYVAGAAALARSLDPTRPIGMAVSAWPGIGCKAAYAPLDVVGFNDYFGWYSVASGSTADRDSLSAYLDEFRNCYPKKALFVSEFGFEASTDGPVEQRGTYAFQANSALFHLGVFASKPWLSGAIYWALQDFVCRPGWTGGNPFPDPPFFYKGLIDLAGNPKPAFAQVAAAYAATPQIASVVKRRRDGPAPTKLLPSRSKRQAIASRPRRTQPPAHHGGRVPTYTPDENRQRSRVPTTRNPSSAVSFLPSSVARAR